MLFEIVAAAITSLFGLCFVAAIVFPLFRHIRDQDKISTEQYLEGRAKGWKMSFDDYVRFRLMEINSRRIREGKSPLTADQAMGK